MNLFLELEKCKNDIVYFVEKHLEVLLHPIQKGILWQMAENDRVLVNSCRQAGKTHLIMLYSIWVALFHNDRAIAIITTKHDMSNLIYKMMCMYLRDMDTMISPGIIQFTNGSIIRILSESVYSVCGYNFDEVLVDEFDFFKNPEEYIKRLYPVFCGAKSPKLHILSTKNKEDGLFYKWYVESKHPQLNDMGFKSISVNWWDVPGRDLKWKHGMIEMLGLETFNKEYLADF